MIDLNQYEIWLVTGSQHLYGDATLRRVAEDLQKIARGLSETGKLPLRVVFKPVVTTPEAIQGVCQDANNSLSCVGLIAWMHTFSPAKMWIAGLKALQKPFVHLHTQFNRGAAVVQHRYGFHEPQPIGAWRSRVRIHRHPHAAESPRRGWSLAG